MQDRILALALAFTVVATAPARASDGVIEINQACVATGCLAGDTAGFPVTLGQSGSYRLTSNLSPTTAQTAIDVTANDVAIDLGGFTIASTNVCTGPPAADSTCTVFNAAAVGIRSSGLRTRVRAGAVVGMGGSGIDLGAQAEVDRVSVANNGYSGIEISSGRVTDCSAFNNDYVGIYVQDTGGIDRSSAVRNGFTGMLVTNAVITHSQSAENRGAGLVLQGVGSLAVANLVYDNLGYGITAGANDGYALNVINGNNGGDANPQLPAGSSLSGNVCGGNTTCP